MTTPENERPAAPTLALRVGISGARNLRADQIDRIVAQLYEVFSAIQREMQCLPHQERVSRFYAHEPQATPMPLLRLISPLARGADRLAARAALGLGYELYVAMPFPQAEYEKDFTGLKPSPSGEVAMTKDQELAEFRELLGRSSSHIALDGARDPVVSQERDALAEHSYEVVGRFVVRHSDLLIAVWDGSPGNGRGGTADIVRYAASAGVPVWWIQAAEDAAPAWIADLQDLRDRGPASETAEISLLKYLGKLIPSPSPVQHRCHSWIGRLGSLLREKSSSLAAEYLGEKRPPQRWIWKTYKWVMERASRVRLEWTEPDPPADPATRYWFDLYQPADQRAADYAARYRSSYVLVILFTTLSLVLGAFALGVKVSADAICAQTSAPNCGRFLVHFGLAMASAELVLLLIIVGLVGASIRSDWHERSIEYRLLAELFRKQETLSALSSSLSIGLVQALADTERLRWVAWLFAAAQRAAPFPQGDMGDATRHKCSQTALLELIGDQLKYHRWREEWAIQAGDTFEALGGAVFIVVLACVILKVFLESHEAKEGMVMVLGLMATVLPGVSAAFVGLRSYAELQLLAEESRHMVALLLRAEARVNRLNLHRPLVSQDLGTEGLAVATIMLQDLEGWGRLFRGKAMEA